MLHVMIVVVIRVVFWFTDSFLKFKVSTFGIYTFNALNAFAFSIGAKDLLPTLFSAVFPFLACSSFYHPFSQVQFTPFLDLILTSGCHSNGRDLANCLCVPPGAAMRLGRCGQSKDCYKRSTGILAAIAVMFTLGGVHCVMFFCGFGAFMGCFLYVFTSITHQILRQTRMKVVVVVVVIGLFVVLLPAGNQHLKYQRYLS